MLDRPTLSLGGAHPGARPTADRRRPCPAVACAALRIGDGCTLFPALILLAGHARGLHCGAPAGALLLLPRIHERQHAVSCFGWCSAAQEAWPSTHSAVDLGGGQAAALHGRPGSALLRVRHGAARHGTAWHACGRRPARPRALPTEPCSATAATTAGPSNRLPSLCLAPLLCSYYHPSPPQKVVIKSERTFDGISLDKPGSDANRTGAPGRLPVPGLGARTACGAWLRRGARQTLQHAPAQPLRQRCEQGNCCTLVSRVASMAHSPSSSSRPPRSVLHALCALLQVLQRGDCGAGQGPAAGHAAQRAAARAQPDNTAGASGPAKPVARQCCSLHTRPGATTCCTTALFVAQPPAAATSIA